MRFGNRSNHHVVAFSIHGTNTVELKSHAVVVTHLEFVRREA
jgi:hypothetical protein